MTSLKLAGARYTETKRIDRRGKSKTRAREERDVSTIVLYPRWLVLSIGGGEIGKRGNSSLLLW